MKEAIRQTDAIFALEGFDEKEAQRKMDVAVLLGQIPSAELVAELAMYEERRRIDAAVLAGRVTFDQVACEMAAYAKEHKTVKGFLESRPWRLGT
jgi:hypothetical protein